VSVSFGIVGLPNVGKSTLFNLLTGSSVKVSNYPFCTTDHHDGMVTVPDDRLLELRDVLEPKECIPATIRGVDIAGLVEGASKGEGLGNQFLANIREVDVILHVLRAFAAPDIAHVAGEVNPAADFETVNTELVAADLDAVYRRLSKLKGKAQSGDKDAVNESKLLEHARDRLGEGKLLVREALLADLGEHSEVNLLSTKPQVVVANCDDYGTDLPEIPGFTVSAVPVTMDSELAEMEDEERREFLADTGRDELAVNGLIRDVYRALGLITFYTAANDILQAWPVVGGTTASRAAGRIHTDMEERFVRAAVVAHEDLKRLGSMSAARSDGLVRTEGRDYVVQDGDVIEVAF
jgi:GTP-binding protein YchF